MRSSLPRALVGLCVLLVVLGAASRIARLGVPQTLTFEERHFVDNARRMSQGQNDQNDHPPLGKLWIALTMKTLGDEPHSWRLPSCLLGLGTIALIAWLTAKTFSAPEAGLLGATVAAADGFLLTYSRTALLDIQLTFFALLAVGMALVARGRHEEWLGFLGAGCAAGLATGTKFSGIAALLVVLLAAMLPRHLRRHPGVAADLAKRAQVPAEQPSLASRFSQQLSAVCGFLIAYFGSWHIGSKVTGRPGDIGFAWRETLRLYEHHASLTSMDHPATSNWSTWLLPARPIFLHHQGGANEVRAIISLGNPALWWTVSGIVLLFLFSLSWFGARAVFLPGNSELGAFASQSKARSSLIVRLNGVVTRHLARGGPSQLLVFLGWFAFVMPWVLTHRDSYIYHYLPAYAFGLVLLAGALWAIARRHPLVVAGYLGVVAVLFAFYLPVWTALPVHDTGLWARLLLETWR